MCRKKSIGDIIRNVIDEIVGNIWDMFVSYVVDWKGENMWYVNKKSNWRERWEEVRVC